MGLAFQSHLVGGVEEHKEKWFIVPLSSATSCRRAAANHPWWPRPGYLDLVAGGVTWELFILRWRLVWLVSWGYWAPGCPPFMQVRAAQSEFQVPSRPLEQCIHASGHQGATNSFLMTPVSFQLLCSLWHTQAWGSFLIYVNGILALFLFCHIYNLIPTLQIYLIP